MKPSALWAGVKAWLLDWRSHALTVLLVLGMVLAVGLWRARDVPAGLAPAFQAPLVSAQAIDTVDLAAWRARHPGRAVALHFWAEWCAICRLEEGSITALQPDWPVLTVAMQSGDAARTQTVLRQRALPWLAAVDADGRIARAYGLGAVPAFVVLDADGRIRFAEIGYTSEIGMRLRLWWAQNFQQF